jgi:hypothetical protein
MNTALLTAQIGFVVWGYERYRLGCPVYVPYSKGDLISKPVDTEGFFDRIENDCQNKIRSWNTVAHEPQFEAKEGAEFVSSIKDWICQQNSMGKEVLLGDYD